MSSNEIQTVTGTTTPDRLGRTLMHEHLMIGYPGWESDSLRPGTSREEMFSVCVDRIEEIVASHHGLELAGNAYRGTGIPDCVRYANETAIRLFGQLFPSDDR